MPATLSALSTILAFLALPGPADPIEVLVRTKTESITGVVATGTFAMKTSFGNATVDWKSVVTIEFAGAKDKDDVVVTQDRTRLAGRIALDRLELKVPGGKKTLPRAELVSLTARAVPRPVPETVVDGIARSGVTYHLRAPKGWDAARPIPALLVLHGSNMNSKSYVETIVAAFPKLADDYLLIGIDGENRAKGSTAENPAFNYSYVNWMGKSTYTGYPGTERESPALVSEALQELNQAIKISHVFVGGHSQGGFLAYCLFMHFPELFRGAFPASSAVIIQAEPTAFSDAAFRAAQRRNPIAIVHGENDGVVDFASSRYAHEIFEDDGFPAVRLFTDKNAAHMFARLPIEAAVRWLETMTAEGLPEVVAEAQKALADERHRDAGALLRRARELDKDGKSRAAIDALAKALDEKARPDGERFAAQIAAAKDGSWVDSFLDYRGKFATADAAQPALAAFEKLRAQQKQRADELFHGARGDFQKGDKDQGRDKYREIVEKCYASRWYRLAKRALATDSR